jgi:histone deacetylase 6
MYHNTMTAVIYDTDMIKHSTSNDNERARSSHPESPKRLKSIINMIENQYQDVTRLKSRLATKDEFLTAHSLEYYDKLHNTRDFMLMNFDPDMFQNEHTLKAAFLAAGCTCELVNSILSGKIVNGFAAVRPPGHHARKDGCCGFCYINNVMVAALSALNKNPSLQILIVDWDIHYHSGSTDILKDTPYNARQLTIFSLHRYDNGGFYPYDEEGKTGTYYDGRIVNVGFNDSPGDKEYLEQLNQFLTEYTKNLGTPDLIIVSSGFDAARGDPLGQYDVTPEGYKQMTLLLKSICPKVAIVLEGGYNIRIITKCSQSCIDALKQQ